MFLVFEIKYVSFGGGGNFVVGFWVMDFIIFWDWVLFLVGIIGMIEFFEEWCFFDFILKVIRNRSMMEVMMLVIRGMSYLCLIVVNL